MMEKVRLIPFVEARKKGEFFFLFWKIMRFLSNGLLIILFYVIYVFLEGVKKRSNINRLEIKKTRASNDGWMDGNIEP